MDNADFSYLIGRLERAADDNPRVYAIKVGAVAALGYLSIVLVAVAILVSSWFSLVPTFTGGRVRGFAIMIFITGLATLWVLIRALWVRVEEPEGRQIRREEAPLLFEMLDEITQQLGGVPVHSVTLNADFNAGISQVPHWGVFGNYRNHLQIGMPLLIALGIDELKSVLAHEMGHLVGEHGKFSAWIYRQRVTWHKLQEKLEEPSNIFEQVLAGFYGWYAPYFYAYSFVLARNHEYSADRVAATVTSPAVVGTALTRIDLIDRFLSEVFWKRLFDQVEKLPEPPFLPFGLMQRAFNVAHKQWSRPDWLRESLQRYAAEDDTHPSLAERLAALDVQAALPAEAANPCALCLLEPNAAVLLKECDEEWSRQNAPAWKSRHNELHVARWKIAELEKQAEATLGVEQLWEKATLLLDVDREEEAASTLNLLVSRSGKFPKAHMLLGRMLLEKNDERGLQHLTTAAREDPELAMDVGRAGYFYLLQRGRKNEAQRFWDKVQPQE